MSLKTCLRSGTERAHLFSTIITTKTVNEPKGFFSDKVTGSTDIQANRRPLISAVNRESKTDQNRKEKA